jgi:hypothetical protein
MKTGGRGTRASSSTEVQRFTDHAGTVTMQWRFGANVHGLHKSGVGFAHYPSLQENGFDYEPKHPLEPSGAGTLSLCQLLTESLFEKYIVRLLRTRNA